jgi:ABC-type transport system involved in cytochrome bd biosynthesis fused ATPase/permease subunit
MMLIQKTAADMGRNISDRDAQLFGMGEISFEEAMSRARPNMDMDMVRAERNEMQQQQLGFAKGGEASFPDLTGDGKTTQADILKGRGVFAEGDEVSAGPDDIQSALSDIQSVAPEAQVIQQVMTMVMELIQSGASEEEIVAALKQMGLDDEDIEQVMMMLAEQMQSQQDPIQAELSQMS